MTPTKVLPGVRFHVNDYEAVEYIRVDEYGHVTADEFIILWNDVFMTVL